MQNFKLSDKFPWLKSMRKSFRRRRPNNNDEIASEINDRSESEETETLQASNSNEVAPLESVSHNWEIDNIANIWRKRTNSLNIDFMSDYFSLHRNGGVKFRLQLFPKGSNERCKGFMSIYLFIESDT